MHGWLTEDMRGQTRQERINACYGNNDSSNCNNVDDKVIGRDNNNNNDNWYDSKRGQRTKGNDKYVQCQTFERGIRINNLLRWRSTWYKVQFKIYTDETRVNGNLAHSHKLTRFPQANNTSDLQKTRMTIESLSRLWHHMIIGTHSEIYS